MRHLAEPLSRLVDELEKLPGIGARTAERLAFHLLKSKTDEAMLLARAIRDVKHELTPCPVCFNIAEGGGNCRICSDARRDHTTLCVVEHPKDLIALENVGVYRGVYHVLMGRLSPHEGIGPESLTLEQLSQRLKAKGDDAVVEVIVATNPDAEGDATALYVAQLVEKAGVRATRIARGLPTGGSIEFANVEILKDALEGRS